MIYPEEKQTAEAVAQHYNSLDKYYRQLWGEHLHHGYWKYGTESVQQATEGLIELVAEAGKIDDTCNVLDIGCGYGATSRYLSKHKEAQLTALPLSKSQWQHARAHDPESSNPRYILGDFLRNDFSEGSFDVVFSIESSEHMVDKPKFFDEAMRLLKPGGRFVTCAWLAKHTPAKWEVKYLLEPICREGRLPSMGSEEDYQKMMESSGLREITFQDISNKVKKTWAICAYRTTKAVIADRSLRRYLFDKDSTERVFAKTLFRIWTAYNTKSMRYGLFSARKEIT
ncbi:MAG: 2-methyl-6-phytyl-1,4-hydroquinone methyltransferase [Chlamydiae bacterium]|nr:2-methyl-6-phytyl-1,4-hydroquinone methyltransferase [Chlamydiota bacterium]